MKNQMPSVLVHIETGKMFTKNAEAVKDVYKNKGEYTANADTCKNGKCIHKVYTPKSWIPSAMRHIEMGKMYTKTAGAVRGCIQK